MRRELRKSRMRDELSALVEREELYCEKHERIITPNMFWNRRCYASKNKRACKYVVERKLNG